MMKYCTSNKTCFNKTQQIFKIFQHQQAWKLQKATLKLKLIEICTVLLTVKRIIQSLTTRNTFITISKKLYSPTSWFQTHAMHSADET